MKRSLYLFFIFFLGGCTLAQVNVEMVSERTAMENQVLGTYNALDAQMLLAASVRGVDEDGAVSKPPKHSRMYKDAVSAMQTIDFHADDLSAFKRLGWVGENNRGLIEAFEMDRTDVPDDLSDFVNRFTKAEFDHVVERINAARKVLMQRVIYMNENLKQSDIEDVRRVFAGLRAENTAAGTRVQAESGEWKVKKAAR
ncbi:MAG: DUF1318 domain-containing protein [Thermodesulfobacteriota bacterium]